MSADTKTYRSFRDLARSDFYAKLKQNDAVVKTRAIAAFKERVHFGLVGLSEFNDVLRTFARSYVPSRVRIIQQKVGMGILRNVVKQTPQDTGYASGNWQVAWGIPPTGTVGVRTRGDAIRAGIAEIGTRHVAGAKDALSVETLYIVNNVPYISVLEFGGFVPPNPGPTKNKRYWSGKYKVYGTKKNGKRSKVFHWDAQEKPVLVSGGYSVKAPGGMLSLAIEKVGREMKAITDASTLSPDVAGDVAD